MIKKLITITNLNVKTMVKYGSIASISMIFIILVFGIHNGMLAFPIALTAISLSFEDIHVKTLNKTITLILIDSGIVTASFIASINPYLGIPINFIIVFSIAYFLTAKFNPKIYKPFIMLFVFTSFSKVSFESYISRLASVFIGIIFVVLITLLTSRKTRKNIIAETIQNPLTILSQMIENILRDKDSSKLHESFSLSMRNLCYKIYVTRYKNSLTTTIGKVEFDIYLTLEKLNIYIYSLKDSESFKPILQELLFSINATLNSIKNNTEFTQENHLNNFIKENNQPEFSELFAILNLFIESILEIYTLNIKRLNKVYAPWNRSELESLKTFLPSNFKINSIRFRFAVRISFALTIVTFLGHIISLQKFIWIAITIMSVMQPYYEETLSKGRDRVKGNSIGIIFVITLLHFTQNIYVAFGVLIIALYLTYGFKEYYKLSIFTSIASISVASLSMGLREITLSRITFILIGLLVVFLFNRLVLPYNIETGVKTLTSKLLHYNTLLITEYSKIKTSEPFNPNRFRDIVILSTLYTDKLILRNTILKNSHIKDIISLSNHLTINIAFNALSKKETRL